MTATKLLTGRDAPVSNLEMALTATYYIAKRRFEQEQQRAQSKRKR